MRVKWMNTKHIFIYKGKFINEKFESVNENENQSP